MTLRRQRQLLWFLNAALAVAVAAAAVALCRPLRVEVLMGPASAATDTPDTQPVPSVGPLAEYAVIAERDLRRPLEDPKPIEAAAPAPPKLSVQLLGTVIEPSSSLALLRTAGGQSKFLSVGDCLEGATVKAIGTNEATVEFAGQVVTLRVLREEGR